MPANNGYFRRKTRKEGALERRTADVAKYLADGDNGQSKLRKAEQEIVALKHNIQMPKRGRSW